MSEIAPAEAWDRRDEVLFLDVREQHEWNAGHVDGAVHVPMGRLAAEAHRLPADRRIVAVCRSGSRSHAVTNALRDAGFDAVNLVGGMHAWAAASLPYVAEDGGAPRVA